MLVEIAAYFILAAAGVLGWVKFLVERRDRRIDREGRIAAEKKSAVAEAELATIRRRAAAPFLAPCLDRFDQLYVPDRDGDGKSVAFVSPGGKRLLCFMRQEVPRDLEVGTPTYLVVENRNKTATRVSVTLDGKPIELGKEPDISPAGGRYFLLYPYIPEKHGQPQVLELWFESTDGFQDTHRYELIHGVRSLRRVDPP